MNINITFIDLRIATRKRFRIYEDKFESIIMIALLFIIGKVNNNKH